MMSGKRLILAVALGAIALSTGIARSAQPSSKPIKPARSEVDPESVRAPEPIPDSSTHDEDERPRHGHPPADPDEILAWPDEDNFCGDDCPSCDIFNCNWLKCCGTFYVGADYLLTRPRFSNPFFALEQTNVADESTDPEQSIQTTRSVDFDFNYRSAYRGFIGYRLNDCGGDLQFTYWHLNGSSSAVTGPADLVDGTLVIAGQLDLQPAQGEFLTGFMSTTANVYDMEYSRSLQLGGDGGDQCGGGRCPRWDVRWSGGVRVADLRYDTSNFIGPAGGPGTTFGDYQSRFTGAGIKAGMQSRRYLGCRDRFSLYAKGAGSLVIGNLHINQVATTPGTEELPTIITQQNETHARMLPAVDLELGATYEVSCCTYVTAGWFMQAWWDNGTAVSPCTTSFCPVDNSSIMAFDGFFLRAETVF